MPTPVGHALGGVAAAWLGDLVPGDRRCRTGATATPWARAGGAVTIACAILGALADVDLLLGGHRTYSHSVTAVALVALATAVVARRLQRPAVRLTLMCAGAYASHLLFDWLSVDDHLPRGIQLFWPFGDRWFISAWTLFPPTERRPLFALATWLIDLRAIAFEVAALVPVLAILWLVREEALARLASVVPGCDQTPEQRTRSVLRVAEPVVQHVENRHAHVEPDEIGEG